MSTIHLDEAFLKTLKSEPNSDSKLTENKIKELDVKKVWGKFSRFKNSFFGSYGLQHKFVFVPVVKLLPLSSP